MHLLLERLEGPWSGEAWQCGGRGWGAVLETKVGEWDEEQSEGRGRDRRETGGRTNSRKLEKKNVSDGDTRTLGDAHPRSAMEEQVASGFLQP